MGADRPSPAPRVLAALVLLGIAVRLAFALGYWTGEPLTRDEREYLSLARGLTAGHGFVYDDEARAGGIEPFGRAPGYPVFLALVGGGRSVATEVPAGVKLAQSIVGGLGVLCVALLAGRLAGPRAALWGAAGAALYPPLVWIAAYGFSEAVFWPMGLAAAWLFIRADEAHGAPATRIALLTGLLSGAAVLVRPAMLFFLMLAGCFWLFRRRWTPLAALTLGALLLVAPWTVRNVLHHGHFVLVASEGGVTFWTGNHPLAIGEGDMAANPAIKLDNLAFRARHPGLDEETLEPVYYQEALAWIADHPVDWLRLQARKVFYLVVPIGPSYTLHSPLYFWTSLLSYGAALTLAIWGAWHSRRSLGTLHGLWLLAASAVLVCLVFFPQERFRIPVIDPVLIVLAAAVLAARVPIPSAWEARQAA